MRVKQVVVTIVALASVVACGGGGAAAGAPEDASIEDFCAAQDWLVVEGMARAGANFSRPSAEELAQLLRDWAREFVRVGTPENMSSEARVGFERFVDRADDLEASDVEGGSLNWVYGNWENDEEKAFAHFMTNTCGA
ncbi:hypothetical protein [Nocardioides sp.]|uniref:hypothetical protein n=1 Tax=Nocardioides sp. TaxID=35761 RepID=UPI002D7F6D99|nr:hypothetical protein [Nocardioides sp.]